MLEFLLSLSGLPPWTLAWLFIKSGGWIVFVIFGILVIHKGWLLWRENKFYAKQKFILLAIDIPQEHEQSPKAVEQIFASLWGTWKKMNIKERYVEGMFVLPYSFEIVSIEGYIQFLIRTPEVLRDVVEAAIYAQYPDSEIIEVEDYTANSPKSFPSENMRMWGSEVIFVRPNIYPIRTYPAFEHGLTQQFADPLADILELFSRMGPGEQFWMQLVVTPISDEWQKDSQREAKKIAGRKIDSKKSFVEILLSPLSALFEFLIDLIRQGFGIESDASAAVKEELPSMMLHLTPGERTLIESIQMKASKTGFHTKFRFIYLSREESFNKAKAVAGMFGSLKQFSSLDSNTFKPHSKTMTKANYFFVKKRVIYRQNKLLRAFKNRSQSAGGGSGPIILNIEELATVWHFPTHEIKAPKVKRSETKIVEPPVSLPVESMTTRVIPAVSQNPASEDQKTSIEPAGPSKLGAGETGPPDDLPIE